MTTDSSSRYHCSATGERIIKSIRARGWGFLEKCTSSELRSVVTSAAGRLEAMAYTRS